MVGWKDFKAWLPIIIWCGLIFIGSSIPSASVSETWLIDFVVHKTVHLFEYGILAILLLRPLKGRVWLAIFLALLYGVSDEFHQLSVPGREGRIQDVMVDGVGSVVGALFYGWKSDRRKRSVPKNSKSKIRSSKQILSTKF